MGSVPRLKPQASVVQLTKLCPARSRLGWIPGVVCSSGSPGLAAAVRIFVTMTDD